MAKSNGNKKAAAADKQKQASQMKKAAARNAAQRKKKGSYKEYWKGVKTEMSKVVWPTRKELGAFTVVVIATCAFFALAFWAIDSGWLAILRAFLGVTLN